MQCVCLRVVAYWIEIVTTNVPLTGGVWPHGMRSDHTNQLKLTVVHLITICFFPEVLRHHNIQVCLDNVLTVIKQ